MSKRRLSTKEMVATKNKVLSCSTPEFRADSPSRDSDSICDSDAASPVPFLCTQDGAEGETDVVWNFYTPKSDYVAKSKIKNATPISRKAKRSLRPAVTQRQPKRKKKISQKKNELFQELLELNQNLQELMEKKPKKVEKVSETESEDDIFNDSTDYSPKSGLKTNSKCLRKSVLSGNFAKPETESALESDDSINECLIKASQLVEENMLNHIPTPTKRMYYETNNNKQLKNLKTDMNLKIDSNSMDAILNSIKNQSPAVSKSNKYDSPCLNNDSFDGLLENLNDSALERLTQAPIKYETPNKRDNFVPMTVKESNVKVGSPISRSFFGRYSSMPESPTVDVNKPSTSGMVFGRYNSMPYNNDEKKNSGDSPLRCTPDEIKKKHQLARERLLAKRLLPFTSSQKPTQSLPNSSVCEPLVLTQQLAQPKKVQFQPKVASSSITTLNHNLKRNSAHNENSTDLKSFIEKKRQEALMKLRRRQPQNKSS